MMLRRGIITSGVAALLARTALAQPSSTSAPAGLQALRLGPVSSGVRAVNAIRNSTAAGVTTQTIAPLAASGVPATNWALVNNASGLSLDWSAVTDAGIPGLRTRAYGTTVATTNLAVYTEFDGRAVLPVVAGQVWTCSVYYKMLSGASAGFNTRLLTLTSGGAVVNNVSLAQTAADGTLRRASQTLTVSATAVWITFDAALGVPSSTVIDQTYELLGPQLELGAFANPWVATP